MPAFPRQQKMTFPRLYLALGLFLFSSVCLAYDKYHWQSGFPAPIQGEGATLVAQQHEYLLKQKSYLQRRLADNQPVIRWISEQVKNRHLPPLLAFVPLIESSYRLDVVSAAGAAGPWQLMPDTATRFSVPITREFDGRYSLPLATEAALTYLGWLYRFFGENWLLALAAYNAGEGRVLKAVMRAESRNVWELDLPTETRLYVARFVALANLLDRAERFQLQLPPWQAGSDVQVFQRVANCSLMAWASAKGISMNQALRWNPAWQLPEASGIGNCPVVYRKEEKVMVAGQPVRPQERKAVSLESLHDPLLLRAARGLDMTRSEIRLLPSPDPLGMGQTRPLF